MATNLLSNITSVELIVLKLKIIFYIIMSDPRAVASIGQEGAIAHPII